MRATVSERGQVVIPKNIREQLGLKKGSVLEVTVEDDKVVMKPVANTVRARHWEDLKGLLKGKYTTKQFLEERQKDRELEAWK